MNEITFYSVLKSLSEKAHKETRYDSRIKKDFDIFVNQLNIYNKINTSNLNISSSEFETLWTMMISKKKLIKTCCNKYRLN